MPEDRNDRRPVRYTDWLWRVLAFFWVAVVLALATNVAANWMTSPNGFPSNTPIAWLNRHPIPTFSIIAGLFFLTVIIGLVQRGPAGIARTSTSLVVTSRQHAVLAEALYKECLKQLSQLLQQTPMLSPDFRERADLTRSSRQFVFGRTPFPAEQQLEPGTSITEIHDHAGLGFLLLGRPGSGKTTLLLELADELLSRARRDASQPIAVILNLSSWGLAQPALESWLETQLWLAYGIPSRLSRALLDQERLLLLLDGLDEVAEPIRAACIDAINAFRKEHLLPVVVCSRDREYVTQAARLALPTAIFVQPLRIEQVAEYLERLGNWTDGFRQMLRDDSGLRELMTTPLMLHVAVQAYRGDVTNDQPRAGSLKQRQQQIFDHYVDRMLSEQGTNWQFAPQQIRSWLVWLARQMTQHAQTEFYLESIQPTWLPSERWQRTYRWASRILHGLIYGLAGGALVTGVVHLFADHTDTLALGLAGGLTAGLAGGSRNAQLSRIRLMASFRWSWSKFRHGAVLGLLGGLTYGVIGGPLIWFTGGGISSAVLLAILGGVLGVLIGKFLGKWLIGLLSGFLGGLVDGMIGQQLGGLRFGVLFGAAGGLTGAVLFGSLSAVLDLSVPLDMRTKPNQGVLSSGRNGLRLGTIVGVLVGPGVGLIAGIIVRPQAGLVVGSLLGLGLAVFVACGFGGEGYVGHYLLRLILAPTQPARWQYSRILEESADRILLRRVGGGYSFIHPMFQDYFADLDPRASAPAAARGP